MNQMKMLASSVLVLTGGIMYGGGAIAESIHRGEMGKSTALCGGLLIVIGLIFTIKLLYSSPAEDEA